MLKFNDPAMLTAARGRYSALRWRFGINVLFVAGAMSAMNSIPAGLSWFLVQGMAMLFDQMLAKSYLEARGEEDRRNAGALFVWGVFFSIVLFAAMPLVLAWNAGGAGRVLGVLMLASSLVSVAISTFQAPRFMLICSVPSVLSLLAMPFIPFNSAAPSDPVLGAIGVACGVAGFLFYMGRSAFNNTKMVEGWRTASAAAKERQLEAELKRAEAEEANRAKSEFLAVMTHELRTPLNAVIGYAEIIEEDLEGDGRKDLADDAGKISTSARHLLGLIDQILNMSSVDAGHEGLALREVDVRKLIEDAIAHVAEDALEANNRISMRVQDEAALVYGDGNKLAVSLGALVSNAVKFSANGLIAISAEVEPDVDGDVLAISVSDTGVGIARENLARVFEPFAQIETGATRVKGGMGLGLSIAQRMARAMGGDVSAVSEFGSGSTFTLRTPMRAAPDQHLRAVA